MTKERRLGRGLEALLGISGQAPNGEMPSSEEGSVNSEGKADAVLPVTQDGDGQIWLELNLIDRNPYQPRQQFDEAEIADLCDSIRAHGFLQPIVVRKLEGRFQIVAGERRYRAAQLANWERVPVQIREVDERQMAELAIVENVQRKDLNALEKAASFDRYLREYGCTQEELAARVHIDRSTVANLIRLLELPEEVKKRLSAGEISQGHARALLPLGDEDEQREFARRICEESLSVRATEQMVQDHIHRMDGQPLGVLDKEGNSRPAISPPNEHLAQMEEQLRLALGTKVDLRQSAKGRGKITIHFKSNEEFERIQAVLHGTTDAYREAG